MNLKDMVVRPCGEEGGVDERVCVVVVGGGGGGVGWR